MGVVNSYENVVARSSSGEIRSSPTYTRTFTVRCDNPDTSMVDIAKAPGINYGDPHPHDASCFVVSVDVDADGESMLIYTVSYTYSRPVGDLSVTGGSPAGGGGGGGGGDGGDGNTPPDPLEIPEGYWSGSCVLQQETQKSTYVKMTNGRPYTSGVLTDYSSVQLKMTNFYESFYDVEKLLKAVDMMNLDSTWGPGSGFNVFAGKWKIVDVNWSSKQQSSDGLTIWYYEVNVTIQSCKSVSYRGRLHDLQGWPDAISPVVYDDDGNKDPDKIKDEVIAGPDADGNFYETWTEIPYWLPQIPSAGFQEIKKEVVDEPDGGKSVEKVLTPITVPVKYYNCKNEEIPPDKLPVDEIDENTPCQWPAEEPSSEELPLDWEGKAVKKDAVADLPCIVVPWTEEDFGFGCVFEKLFGLGPPHAPKKQPELITDFDLWGR